MRSQPLPRHENEKTAECGVDKYYSTQYHQTSLRDEFPYVWFSDGVEGEKCVFAEAEKAEDGVKHVLMCRKGIDAGCERED